MLGTILLLAVISVIIALGVIHHAYASEWAATVVFFPCLILFVLGFSWVGDNINSASIPCDRITLVDRIDSARRVGITTDAELIYIFGEEVREFNACLASAQQWNKTFDWWYADVVDTVEPVSLWPVAAPLDSMAGVWYGKAF